jgi:hypothetical protein
MRSIEEDEEREERERAESIRRSWSADSWLLLIFLC